MNYFVGYLLLYLLLTLNSFLNISPTATWLLGYVIIFLTIAKKNPLDPQAWVFFAWGLLFTNVFSGVIYIPATIEFLQPVTYMIFSLFSFHMGFNTAKTNGFIFNKEQVKDFLNKKYSANTQSLVSVLGFLSIVGSIMIAVDIFFIHGYSINGGDRRSQLQENDFTPLTTVGMILLGGSYLSALSLFFGGNLLNKILAIFALAALALSSIALAGKQGVLITLLIMLFGYLVSKYFKSKLQIPVPVKILLYSLVFFFGVYIVTLSSERQGNVDAGELFTESTKLNKDFVKEMSFLPDATKNTFAEFFGYYGEQLPTFAERWKLDDYVNKYPIVVLPPRVLNPFTWFERQVIKIVPFYGLVYHDEDWIKNVQSQKNGYYGIANWQTTNQHGLIIFGFLGQLIVIFFHGYYSRQLYESVGSKIKISTLNMCLLNNIFLLYTIMMNFLGETSAFFYMIIIFFIYFKEKRTLKMALQKRYLRVSQFTPE